ncbi:isoprenoid biosynthesis glyoxalase ElbB [Bdellovibrionota bacterium FG-2]
MNSGNPTKHNKIAVILCGSGFKDGSEIHESVAVLWALSQHPLEIQCFAPDANQADVINCLTSQPMIGETRNMLVESARIARGEVLALSKLDPTEFSSVILPGGFGAAKNLCSFACKGTDASVRPELQKILTKFHSTQKPIGAICIAPMILALAFRDHKFELTVGPKSTAGDAIEQLGHRHIACHAHEMHVDATHKIVTTPAYMIDDAPLHEIFTGIQKLVAEIVKMI